MSSTANQFLKSLKAASLFVIPMLLSCSTGTFGMPNAVPMDWAFIQSVGGIRLGDPYTQDGMRWVPVIVDVSGTQTITVTPSMRNTGLVCSAVTLTGGGGRAPIGGMDMWLTVHTEPESSDTNRLGLSSRCADLPLNFRSSFGGSSTARFYYIQSPAVTNVLNSKENLIGVISM